MTTYQTVELIELGTYHAFGALHRAIEAIQLHVTFVVIDLVRMLREIIIWLAARAVCDSLATCQRSFVDWNEVGTDFTSHAERFDFRNTTLKCADLFSHNLKRFDWNAFYQSDKAYQPNYLDDVIFQKTVNWFDTSSDGNILGLSLYDSFKARSFLRPSSYIVLIFDGTFYNLIFLLDDDELKCELPAHAIQCCNCGCSVRKTSNFAEFRNRIGTHLEVSSASKSAAFDWLLAKPLVSSMVIPSDHLWSVKITLNCNGELHPKQMSGVLVSDNEVLTVRHGMNEMAIESCENMKIAIHRAYGQSNVQVIACYPLLYCIQLGEMQMLHTFSHRYFRKSFDAVLVKFTRKADTPGV